MFTGKRITSEKINVCLTSPAAVEFVCVGDFLNKGKSNCNYQVLMHAERLISNQICPDFVMRKCLTSPFFWPVHCSHQS